MSSFTRQFDLAPVESSKSCTQVKVKLVGDIDVEIISIKIHDTGNL